MTLGGHRRLRIQDSALGSHHLLIMVLICHLHRALLLVLLLLPTGRPRGPILWKGIRQDDRCRRNQLEAQDRTTSRIPAYRGRTLDSRRP